MRKEQDTARIADGRAWEDFCDRLKSTGQQILEAAPDDDFDRAEGLRYLSRLTSTFLGNATADPIPARSALAPMAAKIGLDNPDYVYFNVPLDSHHDYTIRGRLGDAHLIGFGTFSGGLGTKQGLIRDGYLESSDLELGPEDHFELRVSRERTSGNWLGMAEGTNSLQIRQTLLERARQRPSPIELERLGEGEAPRPLDPARFAAALDRTGNIIAGTVGQFLGWTADFAAHPHQIRPLDPALMSFAQGDPNTSYNYGYWELSDDEAFVIEFTPPECEYWNLQIGNHWLESFDFMHRASHVNHHTAVRNGEGRVRIVVAGRDPGVPNWLDTAGHTRGALALRWVGAKEIPETRTRLMKLSSLT
ncbi:MAG: hypothetical protein VCB42_02175 [Myxococcota bacterium]